MIKNNSNNNPRLLDSEPIETEPITKENMKKAKEMVKKLLEGAKTNEKNKSE